MSEYKSSNFSDLFHTEFGKDLWVFLNTDEMKIRMQTASDLGKPAVEAIAINLELKYKSELHKLRIRQMIGHMVRQIMEDMGYQLDCQNVRINTGGVFRKGSRYINRKPP
ncbi:MAG: hypothetical protein WCK67_01955 [bacterium]